MLMAGSIFFFLCGIGVLLAPSINITLSILSGFTFLVGIFFVIITDRAYLAFSINGRNIVINSFFNLKRYRIPLNSVLGYEMQQRVDDFNGLHNMLVLVLSDGSKIVFPKLAYEDYGVVEDFFSKYFQNLGHKPLKYADFFKKTIPAMSLVSGILALMVALLKIFGLFTG